MLAVKVVIFWLFTEVDFATVATSTSVKSQEITTLGDPVYMYALLCSDAFTQESVLQKKA